jgi:Ala-tRNA(Pro) deacylase
MTTLRDCIEYLDERGVPYTHTFHATAYRAREVASAEHVPPGMIAKTVLFCGDDFYGLAVLPADCLLDLDRLAPATASDHLRLATEQEVALLFPGCEVGAMPPLGDLFDLPVYLDERLAREKHIVFNAGTHRDAIHMKTADYLRVASPVILRMAHLEAMAS